MSRFENRDPILRYEPWQDGKIYIKPFGPEIFAPFNNMADHMAEVGRRVNEAMRFWKQAGNRIAAKRAGIDFGTAPTLGPGTDI